MGNTLSDEQNRLIAKFMPLARRLAGRASFGIPIEDDDAEQAAYMGLVEAAIRFDPSRTDPGSDVDVHFKNFASPRIYGSVIDAARANSFVRRRGQEKGIRFYMTSLDEHYEGEEDMPKVQVADVEPDMDMIIDFENGYEKLNAREQRIVLGLGVGHTNAGIAQDLGVSESRVSQLASTAKAKLERSMD